MTRRVHAGAWWLWALGLATAASRTTNPLLLALIVSVAGAVVMVWRTEAPWSRSFGFFLRLGALVIVIRVVFQVLFGAPTAGTVLITLPSVSLPGWAEGVRIGGQVTWESLLAAVYDGMRLAAILACVGAANSLASPSRLLKSVPAAVYELGVSVVVAMSFTPQLVADAQRVRTARRLRGRRTTGLMAWRGTALPVLEGALERSVALAAAMDSRGYGRSGTTTAGRRASAALLLAGLIAACIGSYGLLAPGAPAALGIPMLALGLGAAVVGVVVAGRRSTRTRYRPDPWDTAAWVIGGSGLVSALVLVIASYADPGTVSPASPGWPAFPPLAAAGILVAMAPLAIRRVR